MTNEPSILVFFQRDGTFSMNPLQPAAKSYVQGGERAGYPQSLAVAMVLDGIATCDALKRVIVTTDTDTITSVTPAALSAATHAQSATSPQLSVLDAATAATLIAAGEAVAA